MARHQRQNIADANRLVTDPKSHQRELTAGAEPKVVSGCALIRQFRAEPATESKISTVATGLWGILASDWVPKPRSCAFSLVEKNTYAVPRTIASDATEALEVKQACSHLG